MTAVSTSDAQQPQSENTGYGSKPYRTYVLSALTLIYILNFVDRGLLAVVGPDLVPELGISDTQFGLLTGFGFALLYTIVGIPLGSTRRHRTPCVDHGYLHRTLVSHDCAVRPLNGSHHWLNHHRGVLGPPDVPRWGWRWRGRCMPLQTHSLPTTSHHVSARRRSVSTPWALRWAGCLPT